jgi:hypothetical protein
MNKYVKLVKTKQGFCFVQTEECNFSYAPLFSRKILPINTIRGQKDPYPIILGTWEKIMLVV